MKVTLRLRQVRGPQSPEEIFHSTPQGHAPGLRAVAGSVGFHCLVIAALGLAGPAPPPPPVHYSVTMLPREARTIIWYRPTEQLPRVASDKSDTPGKPPVEVKRPGQSINTRPKEPARANQFIWQPAPKIELHREAPSPNLLVLSPPSPPRAPVKAFVPPPEQKASAAAPTLLPEPRPIAQPAPGIAPQILTAVNASPKPPLRQFVPPPVQPKASAPAPVALPEAHPIALATPAPAAPAIVTALNAAPKPPLRQFVPPPSQPKPNASAPDALPEARPLAAATPAASAPEIVSALTRAPRPPVREFVAPPQQRSTQAAVALDAAPALPEQHTPSAAVIGLNPVRTKEIPLPEGNLPARISAGPENSTKPGGAQASLVVPGLTIDGGKGAAGPAVAAVPPKQLQVYREPTALEWAHESFGKDSRHSARYMMSAALRPGARIVSTTVDSRFPNRPVYTTTFDVGSDGSTQWIVWFADRGKDENPYSIVRPPIPWKKRTDAPDVALPASGKAQVAAVIDQNGVTSAVTVIGGAEIISEAARQLVSTWMFLPALRNNKPLEIDAYIEITFHASGAGPANLTGRR